MRVSGFQVRLSDWGSEVMSWVLVGPRVRRSVGGLGVPRSRSVSRGLMGLCLVQDLGFVGPGSLSPKFGLGSLGLRLGFGDSGPCVSRPRLLGSLIRSRAGPWSVRGRVLGPSGGGSFRGRLSGDSTGDPRLGDQHLVHPR